MEIASHAAFDELPNLALLEAVMIGEAGGDLDFGAEFFKPASKLSGMAIPEIAPTYLFSIAPKGMISFVTMFTR